LTCPFKRVDVTTIEGDHLTEQSLYKARLTIPCPSPLASGDAISPSRQPVLPIAIRNSFSRSLRPFTSIATAGVNGMRFGFLLRDILNKDVPRLEPRRPFGRAIVNKVQVDDAQESLRALQESADAFPNPHLKSAVSGVSALWQIAKVEQCVGLLQSCMFYRIL